eukprot:TRINITY_DN112_c0_g1_i1.p1 TRINITY_DN112_c0_g1~~TRINITY_DN112_c0_g1_i1.p1  ORF type:complete len:229 (-),score=75.73 TRINITY_DN112_c0_g1_i1:278-898(-)
MSAEEQSRLWRIRRTVAQMLADREYLVGDEDTKLSFEDFKEKYGGESAGIRDRMTLLARQRDDPTDQIFVFFPEEAKVGVKPIRNYIERMDKEKITRAIIVAQTGITAFARTVLHEMSDKYVVEQFQEDELLVNITEHVLVPRHKVLSSSEKQALLDRYKLKETQLPRIQVVDPVARYYGLTRGQVVKIIRPSETAGRYVTYRLVV